ncbi:MAG: hypothetical protein ACRDIV_16260, partial [Ktedonobacteraceae bacterium]
MKSQFAKFSMQQGDGSGNGGYVPDHIAAMNNWSSALDGNDSRANHNQPPQPPRSGLLSNWNAGNMQGSPSQPQPPQQPGAPNPDSIVEQDTLEQRIVQQQPRPSLTPPPQQYQQAWQMGQAPQPVNPQVYMNGPASPRESGITPYSTIFPNGPVPPAMQMPPVQQPVSQALNPSLYPPMMNGPTTNAPVMSMPGYAQVPMQSMGGYNGYPGPGGPPYMQ